MVQKDIVSVYDGQRYLSTYCYRITNLGMTPEERSIENKSWTEGIFKYLRDIDLIIHEDTGISYFVDAGKESRKLPHNLQLVDEKPLHFPRLRTSDVGNLELLVPVDIKELIGDERDYDTIFKGLKKIIMGDQK